MKNVKNLVKAQIIELLSNEESILINTIQEINSYNGDFDNLIFHNNDEEFFETFFYNSPFEVARATFYGNYNFNDDYVYFNVYGNLETFNYIYDFISNSDIEELSEYIVENNNISYDENIEIYLELLEYEKEFNIFSSVVEELMNNDKNAFYDEILVDCDYNIIYAINELKENLIELINNEENKNFYSNLLKKLENIEE